MRAAPALALVTICAGLAAAPLAGQKPVPAGQPPQAQTCVVVVDSVHRAMNLVQIAGGQYRVFAGGGVWARCREQPTTMYSDSIAWFPERGELRLLGNVHFRDSTSLLDADHVTYWVRQEHLVARGNVYTQNTRTKSDLRGPNLDYYRAVPPIRDTLDLYANGRPTIHFYSARDSAAGDSAKPFVVVADRVHMRHNDKMWSGGRVTIDRTDLAARGDSAQLDLSRNHGLLLGQPEVRGTGTKSYRLVGRRIAFDLTEVHEVRRVLSSGAADAQGQDWRLTSDTLDIALDSGAVQRAQAWGRTSRSTATSGLSTIVADSLDIHMPQQVVRLVWGYGRARATSKPDTTVTEEDWLVGDTLRANFAERDTAGQRRSDIEHVTAFGSARAYYHTESREQPEGERGINYSRGRRIDIALKESKVQTVDIVGQVDGVYLEPLPPGADTARADSAARADSTRVPGARPDTTVRSGRPPAIPPRPDSSAPRLRRAPPLSQRPARSSTP